MTAWRRLHSWGGGAAIVLTLGMANGFHANRVEAQTPPAPTQAPIDVRPSAEEIFAWQLEAHRKLLGTPEDTQAKHQEVDAKAHEMALSAEAKSQRVEEIESLFKKAKVQRPDYTGTPPTDTEKFGGPLSDVEFKSLQSGECLRLEKTFKGNGYHPYWEGDAMVVPELGVVVHRAPAENFAPVGSSASETAAIGHAASKETATAFQSGDPYFDTLDNLKKGGPLLDTDPATFTLKEVQDYAKMISRNMRAAGVGVGAADPLNPLLQKLESLKIRQKSLYSAGLTPDHSTPAQRAQAEKEFWKLADEANRTAIKATRTMAEAKEAALHQQVDNAPDAAARNKARAELRDYLNQRNAAEGAVDGDVWRGLDAGPVGEKSLSPSQAKEAAVKGTRARLKDALNAPVEPPVSAVKPASRIAGYGGRFLLYFSAVNGAIEGARQARAEAKPGEWFVTTAAKGTAYGVLYTLGIPEAFRVGTDAGNESIREFQADVAAGKDPWIYWAAGRGAVTGVFRFGKAIIDPVVIGAESLGGKLGDEWRAYRAELDHLAAEQVQSQQAVGIARNLARDLAAAVKAADAEIKVLRPLTARVEETRRLANQLRTRLDALQTANDIHCRRAAAGSAAVPAANTQTVDPKLPAELADIAKEADGVCRAADQVVSAFTQQQINAQGVSFRLENALRPPLQDAQRRLDAARRGVDTLAGTASGDAALLQAADQAYQEAAALAQQATALAASIDTTTAAFQYEVSKLRAAATQAADMRQRFIDGVKRFSGVSPEQDTELRGLVQDVSPLKIDSAALAELEAAARSFAALSALLTNDIARRVPPPCPALAALAGRWTAIWQRHGDLKTALDAAAARVTAGRMCLDRVTALVPAAPPVTKPMPPTAPDKPPVPAIPRTALLLPDVMKAALPRLGYSTWRTLSSDNPDLKEAGAYLACETSTSMAMVVCAVRAIDRMPSPGGVAQGLRLTVQAMSPEAMRTLMEQDGGSLPKMDSYRGQQRLDGREETRPRGAGEEWSSWQKSVVIAPGLLIKLERGRACSPAEPGGWPATTRRDRTTGAPLSPCPAFSPVAASNAEIDALLDEAVKARMLPAGTIK